VPPAASPARALVSIATYNERDNLQALVREIHAEAHDAHVLVIDDHSPDGTGELADRMAADDPRVHVLHRPGKLGLGTAILAAMRWAMAHDYDYLVNMDADFSHHPRYLPALLGGMKGRDVMIGSRYVPGGGTENWGLVRRMISRFGSLYTRMLLMPVNDPTSGFKCFRREVLERIDLDAIDSKGYAFQIENVYRARRAGFRVVEVPITFAERTIGHSKMSRTIVLEAIWKVPVIRLRALVGRL
jgi:dolichol-phosphate mannosyltransferase